MTFLGANGYPVVFGDDWDRIVEQVADGGVTKAELVVIIVSRLLGASTYRSNTEGAGHVRLR